MKKCLVAKTYEAAQLGNCNLKTAEMQKMTSSTQSGLSVNFTDFQGNKREVELNDTDNLIEKDIGAQSRSGICYQNPSLMTRNDLKDSINFCQRFQNAQTQEERADLMREFQITLKGEGGRDGWIPSARNCNDFCYNLATYQSRTNQGPRYLEKAWEKPWNWTHCAFDNARIVKVLKMVIMMVKMGLAQLVDVKDNILKIYVEQVDHQRVGKDNPVNIVLKLQVKMFGVLKDIIMFVYKVEEEQNVKKDGIIKCNLNLTPLNVMIQNI